jgi:hypothetical protein
LISELIPCPGGARALYSLEGVKVIDLSDLVKGSSYVIVGRERYIGVRDARAPAPALKQADSRLVHKANDGVGSHQQSSAHNDATAHSLAAPSVNETSDTNQLPSDTQQHPRMLIFRRKFSVMSQKNMQQWSFFGSKIA